MKLSPLRKRSLAILTIGLVVGLISMALIVTIAQAAQPIADERSSLLLDQVEQEPVYSDGASEECIGCHVNIYKEWQTSSHAHAYDDPVFLDRWNGLGNPKECLACHTTNFQAFSSTYTAEGIQCEACHGPRVEGHPPAVMPVRTDAEFCGACHVPTLGEWRLTGHARAGITCIDCHNAHSQDPLFANPDELCLNCHRDDMGRYLEDLHTQKGIGCVDCHALVIPPDPVPVDGLVPTGHSFILTPQTCVACHTDTLHAGFSLPGYENGAKAAMANQEAPAESTKLEAKTEIPTAALLETQQRIQALEAALASARFSSLFQGAIIGLVLGGITVYYLSRNQQRISDEAAERETIPSDGEVVDQVVEQTLTYIERGIEWMIKATKTIGGLFTRRNQPDRSEQPKKE